MDPAEVVVPVQQRIGENGVFLFWLGREEWLSALLEGEYEKILMSPLMSFR